MKIIQNIYIDLYGLFRTCRMLHYSRHRYLRPCPALAAAVVAEDDDDVDSETDVDVAVDEAGSSIRSKAAF